MGTSAQKLQKIRESKESIRLAIEAKGVNVPVDTKLADYSDKIALIDEWVPPSDWIQLEEPNDNEILLLASDINPHYSFVVNVVGGYTVDWGDGTIDNWFDNSIASHSYLIGSGKSCSRGYTTFKIRIYAQLPANNITLYITLLNQLNKPNTTNGFLWAKFGTRYIRIRSLFGGRDAGLVVSRYLECVELPETMLVAGSFSLGDTCKGSLSLQKFRMPKYLPNVTGSDFDQSFTHTKLRSFDMSALRNVGYFLSGFNNSFLLKDIKMPENFVLGTIQFNSFIGVICDEIIMPPITNQLNGGFFNGFRGKKIVFNETHENKLISLKDFFNGCTHLTELTFPMSVNLMDANIQNFMSSCWSLKQFRFPDNIGTPITHSPQIFLDCYNMETISNFPPMPNSTNIGGAFRFCYSLKNIDNLEHFGNTTSPMNLDATYLQCYSLNPVGGLKVRNNISGRFVLAGVNIDNRAALEALLFTNPNAVSTWVGASPQIDVAFCSMNEAALNALFTSIISTSASFAGKTIRITGNPGADTCDTTIITNAGGTVNKTN